MAVSVRQVGVDSPASRLPRLPIMDQWIMEMDEKQRLLHRHDFHGEWNYCLHPAPP